MESIFETKEQYLEFIKKWKKSATREEGPNLTLQHFILYRMLKGKDWKICLAEGSAEETIANAHYWAKECNVKYLSLWPFGDSITHEMIEKARRNMEIAE